MSKSIIKIRRKSDDKILFDVINDSCQVHNIFDDGKLIGSFKEWEIDYMDNDFLKDSPYEEIESITEDEWNAMADAYENSIYKELEEYKDKFKEKIDELGCLKLDWDGRGACPIMPESLNNLIKLKECYGDWNFDLWQISPGVNGDIYLNFKKGLAAIVIYSHLYSWFTENTNKLYGSANLMFDAETVCNLMKKIEKNEINNN